MVGRPYEIRKGETLWAIAAQRLGDPKRWRELWQHNNSDAVSKITKSRILAPDLIFEGQRIYIDKKPTKKRIPFSPQASKEPKLPNLMIPARDGAKAPLIELHFNGTRAFGAFANYQVFLQIYGKITLQNRTPVTYQKAKRGDYEIEEAHAATRALAAEMAQIDVRFEPESRMVSVECSLTRRSKLPAPLMAKAAKGMTKDYVVANIPMPERRVLLPEYEARPGFDFGVIIRSKGEDDQGDTEIGDQYVPGFEVPRLPKALNVWESFALYGIVTGNSDLKPRIAFDPSVGDDQPSYGQMAAMFSSAAAKFLGQSRPTLSRGRYAGVLTVTDGGGHQSGGAHRGPATRALLTADDRKLVD